LKWGFESENPFFFIAGSSTEPTILVPSLEFIIESGEHGDPMKVSDITVRPEHPFDERYFVWCAYREAWLGRGRSIRTLDWKLNIYANGDGELYNLRTDSDELFNLFNHSSDISIQTSLEHKLLTWMIQHQDPLPENTTVNISYKKYMKHSS